MMTLMTIILHVACLLDSEFLKNALLIVVNVLGLVPTLVITATTILGVKQKAALQRQMHLFSVKHAKCFDENDRPLVERAIASWFAQSSEGEEAQAITRFEYEVREGKTQQQIRMMIGWQPGLLRPVDLLMAYRVTESPKALAERLGYDSY